MVKVQRLRTRQRWIWCLLSAFLFVVLQGTGPCYDDECSNPGESWCEGDTVVACTGAGMNQAYQLRDLDCAAQGLACVEGRGSGYWGTDSRLSWCLDTQTCEVLGAYQCGTSPADGQPILMRCVEIASTAWFLENHVVSLDSTRSLQRVLEPAMAPGYGYPVEQPVACVACASTCGCDENSVCRNGWCVPYQAIGETGDDPLCCGRQRGSDCPKGSECEMLDGSLSTCATASRCEPCQTTIQCESSLLQCLSTAPDQPLVCLAPDEVDVATFACREELGQAWQRDACGAWVEAADQVVVGYACREGTDQSWSLNACNQWLELAEECAYGYRCESNQCVKRVPDIEVSPTLLDFGSVSVGSVKTLTLSIGNTGYWPLQVAEVVVQSESGSAFSLSTAPSEVDVSQIASMQVTFSPAAPGSATAKLLVRSDDPDEPERTVLMNGTGTL